MFGVYKNEYFTLQRNNMKKIFYSVLFLFIVSTSFAQIKSDSSKHLTFKGVPIDGTLDAFVLKMKKEAINRITELQGFLTYARMGAETDALLAGSASARQRRLDAGDMITTDVAMQCRVEVFHDATTFVVKRCHAAKIPNHDHAIC